jgi:nicotinamide mononucleotide transporter
MQLTEILGFVTGIAGVYLTIRENPLCFPVGLINVVVSLFLFANQQLYSDALQQAVYFVLLSYGWHQWKFRRQYASLAVTRLSGKWIAFLVPATVGVALTLGFTFGTYTDADVPYLDAGATALSFAAQFLVARKKIENWMLWMVVNIVYTGIYISKDLYLYAVLFTVYFILSVIGYRQWHSHLQTAQ